MGPGAGMEEASGALIVFLASLLFTWNNGSLFIGGLVGSGATGLRLAGILTSTSMVLGLVLEGGKMDPDRLAGEEALLPSLLSTLVMLSVSNLLGVPISVSHVSVASLIGASLYFGAAVDVSFLLTAVVAWLAAPLSSALLSHPVYALLRRSLPSSRIDLKSGVGRLVSCSAAVYASYVLSANNVGFLLTMHGGGSASTYPAAAVGIVLGALLFSERISYVVGDRLAVLSPVKLSSSLISSSLILWVLTQLGIPGSLTQVVLGGFLGAASASPVYVINRRLVDRMIASWILTMLASVPLAYAVSAVIGLLGIQAL